MSNLNYLIKNCDYELACYIKGFSIQKDFSVYFESDDPYVNRFNHSSFSDGKVVDIATIDWDDLKSKFIDAIVKERHEDRKKFEGKPIALFKAVPFLFDSDFEEVITPCTWTPQKKSVSVTVLESEYIPEMSDYYSDIQVFKPNDLDTALTASEVIYTNFNDLSYIGGISLFKGLDQEILSPTVVVAGKPIYDRYVWNCMVVEKSIHPFQVVADHVSFLRKYKYCYRDYLKYERNRSK